MTYIFYSLKANSAHLIVCQYFFSWKEKNSHHVMRLDIPFCKGQNVCNSPHNLVIAPFYKVNSAFWCFFALVGLLVPLIWLWTVCPVGIWTSDSDWPGWAWCNLKLQHFAGFHSCSWAPRQREQAELFFPHAFPPLQTSLSGSGFRLLNLPFLGPYSICLILPVLTF